MTEKVKYAAIKAGVFLFFIRMTWRWTAGSEPDNLCQLCISIASQSAIDKVRENGWTPPLIPGTLGGIRANTRTRTSVISPFLSSCPLSFPLFLCRLLYSTFSGLCLSSRPLKSLTHTHTPWLIFQVYMDEGCTVCSSLRVCSCSCVSEDAKTVNSSRLRIVSTCLLISPSIPPSPLCCSWMFSHRLNLLPIFTLWVHEGPYLWPGYLSTFFGYLFLERY